MEELQMIPEINLGSLKDILVMWLSDTAELDSSTFPYLIEMAEIVNSHDEKFLGEKFYLSLMTVVDAHVYSLQVEDLARLFILFKLKRDDPTYPIVSELEKELLMKLDGVTLANHSHLLRLYLLVPVANYQNKQLLALLEQELLPLLAHLSSDQLLQALHWLHLSRNLSSALCAELSSQIASNIRSFTNR